MSNARLGTQSGERDCVGYSSAPLLSGAESGHCQKRRSPQFGGVQPCVYEAAPVRFGCRLNEAREMPRGSASCLQKNVILEPESWDLAVGHFAKNPTFGALIYRSNMEPQRQNGCAHGHNLF